MPGSHLSPKMSVLSQLLMGLLFGKGNIGSEGWVPAELGPSHSFQGQVFLSSSDWDTPSSVSFSWLS